MSDSSEPSYDEISPFKERRDEEPTRHPTTVKKKENSPSSFSRSNIHRNNSDVHHGEFRVPMRSHSLRESLWTLENQKYRCLQSGRYSQANHIQSKISRTRSLLNNAELKQLRKTHKEEKKSIKQAYHHQLSFFQNAWNRYFHKFKEFQRTKLTHFKQQQNSEIEFIRDKLRKKCNTLRQPNRQVIDLQREEQHHLRQGNIAELMLVRKQKKKLIQNIKLQRKELINRWTQLEGQQLQKFQYKRYSILMSRMEQQKTDQKNQFLDERKRLRQKYKNVLSQLKHQQKMTKHFIQRRQNTQ